MANPKYIKNPKPEDPTEKIVYSFRIERQKLQKLQQGAEIENKSTAELLNNVIDDLTENTILTNDYLTDHPQGTYFKIPTSHYLKEDMATDPENIKPLYELIKHSYEDYGETETEVYKIDYPPNNCDIWQHKNFSFSSLEDTRKHQGIELLIIPEVENIEDALYFIYSIYDTHARKLELYILNQLDALNFINKTRNLDLIGRVNNLLYDFERVESWEDLEALAKEYNTGNVTRLTDTKPSKPAEDLEIVLIKEGDPDEKMVLTTAELERLVNDTLWENKRLVELVERQDKQINELENEAEKRIKELNDKIKTIEEFLKDNGF